MLAFRTFCLAAVAVSVASSAANAQSSASDSTALLTASTTQQHLSSVSAWEEYEDTPFEYDSEDLIDDDNAVDDSDEDDQYDDSDLSLRSDDSFASSPPEPASRFDVEIDSDEPESLTTATLTAANADSVVGRNDALQATVAVPFTTCMPAGTIVPRLSIVSLSANHWPPIAGEQLSIAIKYIITPGAPLTQGTLHIDATSFGMPLDFAKRIIPLSNLSATNILLPALNAGIKSFSQAVSVPAQMPVGIPVVANFRLLDAASTPIACVSIKASAAPAAQVTQEQAQVNSVTSFLGSLFG